MGSWIAFKNEAEEVITLPIDAVRAIHFSSDNGEIITDLKVHHVLPGTAIALQEHVNMQHLLTTIGE